MREAQEASEVRRGVLERELREAGGREEGLRGERDEARGRADRAELDWNNLKVTPLY